MVELTHMQQLELEKAGLDMEDRLHRQHSTYVDYDTTNQGGLDALEKDLEFFHRLKSTTMTLKPIFLGLTQRG